MVFLLCFFSPKPASRGCCHLGLIKTELLSINKKTNLEIFSPAANCLILWVGALGGGAVGGGVVDGGVVYGGVVDGGVVGNLSKHRIWSPPYRCWSHIILCRT